MLTRPRFSIAWNHHILEMGSRTLIMGVLNVTPDSFSDGGQFSNFDAAIAHGLNLVEAGADILDIGGESTRPFSESVSVQEEIRRVVPVIEKLAPHITIPISIDTTKAAVAREALAAGAAIINDISALKSDPQMASVAATAGVPVILMHMRGNPKTMQIEPVYDDVLSDIGDFLDQAIRDAVAQGIERNMLIADPGIGFGKTMAHNLEILLRLAELQTLDVPILVGPSRKSFIQNLIREKFQKEIRADSSETETGTQATVSAAILNGAHIVRVHDVSNTIATTTIVDAVCNA